MTLKPRRAVSESARNLRYIEFPDDLIGDGSVGPHNVCNTEDPFVDPSLTSR